MYTEKMFEITNIILLFNSYDLINHFTIGSCKELHALYSKYCHYTNDCGLNSVTYFYGGFKTVQSPKMQKFLHAFNGSYDSNTYMLY